MVALPPKKSLGHSCARDCWSGLRYLGSDSKPRTEPRILSARTDISICITAKTAVEAKKLGHQDFRHRYGCLNRGSHRTLDMALYSKARLMGSSTYASSCKINLNPASESETNRAVCRSKAAHRAVQDLLDDDAAWSLGVFHSV